MNAEIDRYITQFQQAVVRSNRATEQVLACISAGRVPAPEQRAALDTAIQELSEIYEQARAAAQSCCLPEEMPPEGSPIQAFKDAVENSQVREYRAQLDELKETLQRFASVRSLLADLEKALEPYQAQAQMLIQNISDLTVPTQEDVTRVTKQADAPQKFLQAVSCNVSDPIQAAKKYNLLGDIEGMSYYSPEVRRGLAMGVYYLPVQEESAEPAPQEVQAVPAEEPTAKISAPSVQLTAEVVFVPEPAHCLAEQPEAAPEVGAEPEPAPMVEAEVLTEDAQQQEVPAAANEAERWHALGLDPEGLLYTGLLQDYQNEASPKANDTFTESRYEKDKRKIGYGKAADEVIRKITELCCINEGTLLNFHPNAEAGFVSACQKLYDMGYLQKFSVPGKGKPYFYTLSKKGCGILRAPKLARSLNVSRQDPEEHRVAQENAAAVMNRILLLRAVAIAANAVPDRKAMEAGASVGDECFAATIYVTAKETSGSRKLYLRFFGICAESVEQYEQFGEWLQEWDKHDEHCEVAATVVLGMNKVQAYKNVRFVRAQANRRIGDKKLFYYDYENEKCSRYSDDAEVGFAALTSDEEQPEQEPLQMQAEETKVSAAQQPEEQSAPELALQEPEMELETVPAAFEPEKETTAEVPEPEKAEPKSDLQTSPMESEPELDPVPDDKPRIDPQQAVHQAELQQMLKQGQMACAAAYLHTLAEKYPEVYETEYEQLAYALNDPAFNCSYNSAQISRTYFSENRIASDYWVIAGALRNFFYDQYEHDFRVVYDPMLSTLHSSLLSMPLLDQCPALKNALHILQDFKKQWNRGMDCYADYRQKDRKAFEKRKEELRGKAAEYYNTYVLGDIKEKSSLERFIIAEKLLFKTRDRDYGFLPESLEFVSNGGTDEDQLTLIAMGLKENFIKNSSVVSSENIDMNKIDVLMAKAWNDAQNQMSHAKKTDRLTGDLHRKLENRLWDIAAVLTEYVYLLQDKPDDTDKAFIASRQKRGELLENLQDALACCDGFEEKAGAAVLRFTIKELLSRLDGSYKEGSNRYFYADFLRGHEVLLDENSWLPVLDEVSGVERFSVLRRIAAHSTQEQGTYAQRLQEIFSAEDYSLRDDYGMARMILKLMAKRGEPADYTAEDIKDAIACVDLKSERERFISDLELAQTYGQITDDSRKEDYLAVMDKWYESAEITENFGFFCRLLDAIRAQIREEASCRGDDLAKNLAVYKSENPHWKESEETRRAVENFEERIRVQNYAAAEDQLMHLEDGDLSAGSEDLPEDELEKLIRNYGSYLHNDCNNSTLEALLAPRPRPRNREGNDARKLISSWPKGHPVREPQLAEALHALGFNVDRVEKQIAVPENDSFLVWLKRPANGRKINYSHPIYIFGSRAEREPFRVICLFGGRNLYTAEKLMARFDQFGQAKDTLVLLDCELPFAERRKLAKLTKEHYQGRTFAVVDRVVVSYLADHYSAVSVNRQLMALIMPYAGCQPYIPDSEVGSMPPEIFIGRQHELQEIEQVSGANIVYGGRQLGKSALLRMAKTDVDHNESGDRAFLVEIKAKDYKAAAREVSAQLCDEARGGILPKECITDDWQKLADAICRRMTDPKAEPIHYLLLMMDEADKFLESCEPRYEPFDILAKLQNTLEGRFKFVVAGLRNVVRFKREVAMTDNNIMPKLRALAVTPFKEAEARELLKLPLWYLGFRFKQDTSTDALVATILGTTNYFPGILQLYCSKLIEALQRNYPDASEVPMPPYDVTEGLIRTALSDKELRKEIRNKFLITLKVGEDDYYYLVALLAAFYRHNNPEKNNFTARDLLALACEYQVAKIRNLSVEAVESLMEDLHDLNVLQPVTREVENNAYRFARFSFYQMMGSREKVDEEIEKRMEMDE